MIHSGRSARPPLRTLAGGGQPGPDHPASYAQRRNSILLVLLATLLFVSLDSIAKYLTHTYPIVQVVWARYAFHALIVVLMLRSELVRHLRTHRLALQITRSFFLLGATAAFFAAVRSMKLVDASAITMAGPLLVTALSVPFLKESVGPRRWTAVAVGFLGALLIIRPGTGMMHPAAIFPVLAMVSYAFYQITTRILSRYDSATTTLIYTTVAGGAVTSAAVPFFWITPDPSGWMLMALLGFFGWAGHFSLIKALSSAPVSILAPFSYTALVWTVSLGFLIFGELPDRWTVIGALIIIGSGIYVLHRERSVRER